MEKILAFCLFAFALTACVPRDGTTVTSKYPDPACPDGYTWTLGLGQPEQGACLRVGMTIRKDCQAYRVRDLDPPYAFWSCLDQMHDDSNALMLMPNPF